MDIILLSKMKKIYFIVFLLHTFVGNSQTFTVNPGSAITDNNTTFASINVTGIGNIGCIAGLDVVCIDITHTYDGDLDIYLIDPQGVTYDLSIDNGGSGNNYSNTCFDMSAGTNVTAASPPYNGTYIPEGTTNFDNANNGQDADGIWQLEVYDDAGGDVGTLNSFSLTFADNAECLPPVVEDCFGGTTVCSDASFSGNSSGSGNVNDLNASNRGCLITNEHESSWYYFEAMTAGTFELIIRTSVDYDFAIWGPYTTTLNCPPTGAPFRCSYAGGGGDTGLAIGSGDNSENSGGDKFVNEINAAAGDKFIMVIDNFAVDGSTFTLDWTLTGGANLNCVPLPVSFSDFIIEKLELSNKLSWKTYSESNNSHFEVQKQDDEGYYYTIQTILGQGNSSTIVDYRFEDYRPDPIINYYRIVQYDFDGKETIYGVKSVDNRVNAKQILKIYNTLGQEVSQNFEGVVIYLFKDGTTQKVYQKP